MDVIQTTQHALSNLDRNQISRTIELLRDATHIFSIGNGGGQAHATHFASDLRKIAGKQAYAFDNMAELTARVNDDGWDNATRDWIQAHGVNPYESLVFVFSVGGGGETTSRNLVTTYECCGLLSGICGAAGGDLARHGQPIVIPSFSTPVIEGIQSVIAHHLVEELSRCPRP